MKDPDILALAYLELRVLVTDDRDFGDLIFRLRHAHAGMIYLRLDTSQIHVRAQRMDDVLSSHEDLLEHFLVVTIDSIRVRRTADR